jgi:hypothetical protein
VGRLKRKLCLQENNIDVEDVLADWGPAELREYIAANVSHADLMQRLGG